jgi:hypothetical protein
VDALTTFNIALSVVLLSVASFMDLVRREVDDWVWLLLASVTGPLTLFRALLYLDTGYPLLVLISMTLSSSAATCSIDSSCTEVRTPRRSSRSRWHTRSTSTAGQFTR